MQNLLVVFGFFIFSFVAQAGDVVHDARQLLGQNNLKKAALLFKQNPRALSKRKVPGLVGRLLESQGNVAKACELYQNDLKIHEACGDCVRLRLARCYLKQGDLPKALPLFESLFASPLFQRDVGVWYEPALAALDSGDPVFVTKHVLPQIFESNLAILETQRREQVAHILQLALAKMDAATQPDATDKVLRMLYLELAETKASVEVFASDAQRGWLAKRDFQDALKRARNLGAKSRNAEVIKTLDSYLNSAQSDEAGLCEARYMTGKALRRLRRYQPASQMLASVVKSCEGDAHRDAFFLSARIAAMSPSLDALTLLNRFLERYADHTYADDVLLWKATVLEKVGTPLEMDQALMELIQKYPNGDMVPEAYFRRAFLHARQGDFDMAVQILKEMGERSLALHEVDERALYWQGRFLLYPSLQNLEPNEDEKKRLAGMAILKELAQERPSVYYGYWAQFLINDAVKNNVLPKKLALKKSRKNASKEPKLSLVKPAQELANDSLYRAALCAIGAGYDDEASLLLDRVPLTPLSEDERIELALRYEDVDRLDRVHQLMRASGLAFPKKFSILATPLPWRLAFAEAYDDEISSGAQKASLSPQLMMGLIREESAFDANAVSWAGAVGLSQLLPAVASEEASALKMPAPSFEEMLNPRTNALLGASHFASGLKKLGHPLFAIAAYNAGLAPVKRWRDQDSSACPIDVFVEQIPYEETRNYVKKVASAWMTYAWFDDQLDALTLSFEKTPGCLKAQAQPTAEVN